MKLPILIKNYSKLLLISLLCVFGCKDKKSEKAETAGYEISGKLKFITGKKMVLQKAIGTQLVNIDSVDIQADSTFMLKGKMEYPDFYRISMQNGPGDFFVLEPKPLSVTIEGTPQLAAFTYKGSPFTDAFKDYRKLDQETQQHYPALQQAFVAAKMKHDDASASIIMGKFTSLQDSFRTEVKKRILSQGDQVVSVFATSFLDHVKDFNFMDSLALRLEKKGVKGELVNRFVTDISGLRSTAVGRPAPDFKLENVEGKEVSLSSLKGKVLLVDFWASWCGPCRMENPNVVRLYHLYKDKGFDILGVSLDTDAGKWKAAIEKDGLVWQQVSDLKGWESKVVPLYKIEGIPFALLLDKEGNIIAKNLVGEKLEQKLKELL